MLGACMLKGQTQRKTRTLLSPDRIPAESEMSRQNRATPPSQCHFPLIRSRQGGQGGVSRLAGGGYTVYVALLGSENRSRYRGVSQLQSHQSLCSVQLRSEVGGALMGWETPDWRHSVLTFSSLALWGKSQRCK